jgi:autotransporter translocation and assembly factor TamB
MKKPWTRGLLAGAGILLGLISHLVLVGSVCLKTDYVRQVLLAGVNGSIRGKIALEDLNASVTTGHIELKALVVKDMTGNPVMGFDRLFVDLAWIEVFRGNLALEAVVVERPWAAMVEDKEGRVSLVDALNTSDFSGKGADKRGQTHGLIFPQNVALRSLTVTGAAVRYDVSGNTGTVTLDAMHGVGRGNLPTRSGRLEIGIQGVEVRSAQMHTRIDRIQLDGELEDDRIAPLRLQLGGGDSTLVLSGGIEHPFSKPVLDMTLDLALSLSEIQDSLTLESSMTGHVKAHGSLRGMAGDPEATVRVEYGGGVIAGVKLDGLNLMFRLHDGQLVFYDGVLAAGSTAVRLEGEADLRKGLDQGRLTIRRLELKGNEVDLRADGHLDLSSQELAARFRFQGANVSPWFSRFKVDAACDYLNLEGEVAGSLKRPEGRIAFRGDKLRYRALTLGDVRFEARLDRSGTVHLSNLNLQNKGSVLQGEGTLGLFRDSMSAFDPASPVDLQLTLRPLVLAGFTNGGVRGAVDGKIEVTGPVKAMKASATLAGADLAIQGVAVGDLDTSLRFSEGTLYVDEALLRNGQSSLRIAGTADLLEKTGMRFLSDPAFVATVAGDHIELGDFFDDVHGRLTMHGEARGTVSNPSGTFALHGKELVLSGQDLGEISLEARLAEKKVWFDPLELVLAPGRAVKATGWISSDRDFFLSGRFDDADLSPYVALLGQEGLTVISSGHVEATGNVDHMELARVRLDLSRLEWSFHGKEFARSKPFTVYLEGGELRIPELQFLVGKDGDLRIQGAGKRAGPVAFQVDGRIPLEILGFFLDEPSDEPSDIRGLLTFSGVVAGTLAEPTIAGEASLEKVGFTIPGLSQRMHDLNGRIRLAGDRLLIEAVRGDVDDGRVSVDGHIDMERFRPARLNIGVTADGVPVRIPDTLDMRLSAVLEITGTEAESFLKGEATILEGTYYKDVKLDLLSGIRQSKREETPLPKDVTYPFLRNMALDISIKRLHPFVVDNNLARLEVSPDLSIAGTFNRPVFRGRTTVDSGTVTYKKRIFVVKKGNIDFLNPYKTEPTFDIEGETQLREWVILLAISGTPENLQLKLSSNPPEADGDILSLLLLGRPTRELISAEGGTSKSPAQMAAQMIATRYAKEIKEATGLDVFETEMGGEGAPDQVKVTLGKELSDRMAVKYTTESRNGEIIGRAIAEYRLFERVLVSGFQDNQGVVGGGLRYRIEFR